jgi:hypothetical protein
MHGLLGVEAAKIQGIFTDSNLTWEMEEKDDVKISAWKLG